MSFILAIVLNACLGFWSQKIYQKYRKRGKKGFIAWFNVAIPLGIMIIELLMYLGVFDGLISATYGGRFASGQEFLWSPFSLFGVDFNIIPTNAGYHWLAAIIVLSYPAIYLFWNSVSKYIFGIRYYSGGWWDILKPLKKPEDYDEPE